MRKQNPEFQIRRQFEGKKGKYLKIPARNAATKKQQIRLFKNSLFILLRVRGQEGEERWGVARGLEPPSFD